MTDFYYNFELLFLLQNDYFMCTVDKNLKLILSSEDTNRDIKTLDKNLDYNLLHNLRIINTGVMIFKSDEWSVNFLNSVWYTKSNTNKGIEFSHKEIVDNNFIQSNLKLLFMNLS